MKTIFVFFIIVLISFQESVLSQKSQSNSGFPKYPEMKFMVFSDPHYFDPSLGDDGTAFLSYLSMDRKLLKESAQLMDEITSKIEKSDADFVLVPGDLTKDGEKINHLKMAAYLSRIKDSGKKVFVVPGNHDINVSVAYKYAGENTERVATINQEEFTEIYGPFGFSEAIHRDQNSLSYVAEPVNGLWLLALDACRYKENPEDGHPITDGKLSKETVAWIQFVLNEAGKKNKALIGMIHHGVLEHYNGQQKHYGEYLVDNYKKISRMLAEYGVRIVFTGHYHAQDITMKQFGKTNYLLDIQTGSLVTYPCPYREITISASQTLKIESGFISSLPSIPEFSEYAREYLHTGIAGIAANTLIGMKVDSTEAWSLSGQVADAFASHYAGDEKVPEKTLDLSGISLKGKFLIAFKKSLVKNLYHDLYPEDNFLEFKLE
jgi:UDP-2,3-diacylglucosamine pyrophosphatase LpxH